MGVSGMEEDYELGAHIFSLVGNSDQKPIPLILLLIPELGDCRDRPVPGYARWGSGPVLGGVPRLSLSWEVLLLLLLLF